MSRANLAHPSFGKGKVGFLGIAAIPSAASIRIQARRASMARDVEYELAAGIVPELRASNRHQLVASHSQRGNLVY